MIRILAFLLLASPAWATNPYDTMVAGIAATGVSGGTSPSVTNHFPFSTNGNSASPFGVVTTTCSQGAASCSFGSNIGGNITAVSGMATSGLYCNNCFVMAPADYNTATNPGAPYSSVIWFAATDTTEKFLVYQRGIFAWTAYFILNFSACGTGTIAYAVSGNAASPVCGTSTVNDGALHMAAVNCTKGNSGGICSLYVDGVFNVTATLSYSGILAGAATDFHVGYSTDGGTYNGLDTVGEFTLFAWSYSGSSYPTALTPAQINALYQCGKYNVCGSAVPFRAPIGQIIGLRDIAPRLPAALKSAYRRIEPAAFLAPVQKERNAR